MKKMQYNQEMGIPISDEDKTELKRLVNEAKPENIKYFLKFIFDCFMYFGVFFGLISLFAWQGGYIHAVNRVMTSQKKLEDWFMGPEAAVPSVHAAHASIPIVSAPSIMVQQHQVGGPITANSMLW